MFKIDPKLLADLVGKDIIACGTGNVGKIVIPYLNQIPSIRLHGVTNTRITVADGGTFLDTGLPIRSIQAWANLMPDATLLITVGIDNELEVQRFCKEAGWKHCLTVSENLVDAIAYTHANLHTVPPKDFLDACVQRTNHEANPLLNLMCLANELHDIHKASFSEFKGCHKGKSVAVVATGPTMKFYSPLDEVVHIGMKQGFKRQDIKLKFYFLGNYGPEWCEELKNYDFVKFFGYHKCADGSNSEFPEFFIEENNGRKFFQAAPSREIYLDITYYPLMGFYSTVFSALHFALYTRPRRLLLIGCDCAVNGHFDGTPSENYARDIPLWLEGYQRLKVFAAQHYPDTEIISINPVGLKGMFRDVYTEEYLDMHPEIDRSKCEILNPDDFKESI